MVPHVSCFLICILHYHTLCICLYLGIKQSNETYHCECPLGFVGEKCERRRTCFSPDCHHEYGRCVGNKICACWPNANGYFHRAYCDPIANCSIAPDLCHNGGECINLTTGGYYCKCTEEFEGPACEKRVIF